MTKWIPIVDVPDNQNLCNIKVRIRYINLDSVVEIRQSVVGHALKPEKRYSLVLSNGSTIEIPEKVYTVICDLIKENIIHLPKEVKDT